VCGDKSMPLHRQGPPPAFKGVWGLCQALISPGPDGPEGIALALAYSPYKTRSAPRHSYRCLMHPQRLLRLYPLRRYS
jgi:hypothetical protein